MEREAHPVRKRELWKLIFSYKGQNNQCPRMLKIYVKQKKKKNEDGKNLPSPKKNSILYVTRFTQVCVARWHSCDGTSFYRSSCSQLVPRSY